MSFQPLTRHTVYQQVADQIAEAIVGGSLPAGSPLPTERDLSEQFGVSRASVREALRALQARGLVVSSGSRTRPLVVTPAAGATGHLGEAFVTLVRLQQVALDELVGVRCALEAAALERAAGQRAAAPLDEARAALGVMRRPEVTVEEFDDADVRFHLALMAASGNRAIHLVMLALRDAVAKHLEVSLRTLPHPHEAFQHLADEHQAILDAVEAGDGTAAAELVRAHIVGFYERFVTGDGKAQPDAATTPRPDSNAEAKAP